MPRKPNRKTKRYAFPKLLKSVHKDNLHPEFGLKKSAVRVRLEASQIAALKKLARESGTTFAEELSNAVDAYCLGLSRSEVRLLSALLDRFKESTARARKALVEAQRAVDKTCTRFVRKKRAGVRA